jgi:predicted ABC-type exoprotein transport system permease subunit
MLSKTKLMSLSLAQLVVALSLPFVTGALKTKIFQQILFFIIALGLSYLITHFWDKKLHYSYPALEFSEIKTITIPCLALASLSYLILQFCPFQFTDWLILTISLSSSVTIFLSLISLKA